LEHISNETESVFLGQSGGRGGYGGGFGGGFGGGGGIWDILALGMVSNGDLFGGRRRDDNCCCAPATQEGVCNVDKDVLSTANQTQHEICEMGHAITATITAGNADIGDKVTGGFYNINDKLTTLAYAQQATAKDTQTLIVEKFAALESKQLAAANCALEAEVNRYKTIEALACNSCNRGGHGGK
jgi:hypothetical protein